MTSWLHIATAPIAGDLEGSALAPGRIVGADGRLGRIVNPRADRTAFVRAQGELAAAETRVAQLRRTRTARESLVADYAASFKQELDLRLRDQTSTLTYLSERLAAERADATRFSSLRAAGSASLADAEAAGARLAALEGERVALEGALARTGLRREAAARGVFVLDDLAPPDWNGRLDLLRAEDELAAALATVAAARVVTEAARENFEQQHAAALSAPTGAIVWSRFSTPGSAVAAGAAVSAWIDPTELLVDVPLSDVEAALLVPGSRARVVIEGERRARMGVVIFARGSAAALGARDLAAVAKGRVPGDAQALVRLEAIEGDRERSPVGRAAHVDFPGINIFTILRARLRL